MTDELGLGLSIEVASIGQIREVDAFFSPRELRRWVWCLNCRVLGRSLESEARFGG